LRTVPGGRLPLERFRSPLREPLGRDRFFRGARTRPLAPDPSEAARERAALGFAFTFAFARGVGATYTGTTVVPWFARFA
jgi:hypothetical protein